MSVIDKLRKRRFYPFEIDGEKVHIRALTFAEIDEADAIGGEREGSGYVIGKSLLNEDGSPVYQQDGQTPKEFGSRVLLDSGIPTDTAAEIIAQVMRLTKGPPPETAIKN